MDKTVLFSIGQEKIDPINYDVIMDLPKKDTLIKIILVIKIIWEYIWFEHILLFNYRRELETSSYI